MILQKPKKTLLVIIETIIAGCLVLFSFSAKSAYAFNLSRPNNKFGIHLAQPHLEDLEKAGELVNSNGGDWGYITLVIQDNDRSHDKWQEIFNLLRQYHLIPIIRLATHPDGASWQRPLKKDASGWVDFLNSLNWVVKNRYVVLFNEPNHGSEWGGVVDVENYAEVAKAYAQALKARNPDFFVMLGALDASAPTFMPGYLGEEYFFQNFYQTVSPSDFDKLFDGLASHSYPNPDFAGSPYNTGRGTVTTYDWELKLLQGFGVTKTLPVFITETGWSGKLLSRDIIASNYQTAFQSVWLPDDRVVAVTPFVFDYQSDPFLGFSWKEYQKDGFYPQFYTVQAMQKTKGDPEQIDTGEIHIDLAREFVANSNYHFKVRLKNTGQAIWDRQNGYSLRFNFPEKQIFEYVASDIKSIKPSEEADVDVYIKTGNDIGLNKTSLELVKNNKTIVHTPDWSFEVIPLPSLSFKTQLYPKVISEGNRFEVQIFDEKEGIVFKKKGLQVRDGKGNIDDIQNIIPGRRYRIVLLNPYYLPRQAILMFKKGENTIEFKRMYPLDLDQNGHLDWGDIGELFKHPELVRLFFP